MKEIFKSIIINNESTFYEVSNYGRVYNTKNKRFLKCSYSGGYAKVTLCLSPNNHKEIFIHRLVANAFIPNPKKLPVVNHIDLNRSNNKITNLEWVDYRGNYLHAIQAGAFEDAVYPKIKKKDVNIIGKMLEDGYKLSEIIKFFANKYSEGNLRQFFRKPNEKDLKILSKYNIRMKKYSLKSKSKKKGRRCLEEHQVKEVIQKMLNGASNKSLAKEYGVSWGLIANIRAGDNWKDLTKGINFPRGLQQDALISKEKVLEVVPYLLKGYSTEEIVKRVKDVKPYHIKRIKLKRIHADILQDYDFPKKVRKIPYEGKLYEYEIQRVIWALINGFTFEKISKAFDVDIEEIKDLYYHRKYNEFTKGIIFGNHNKDSNLSESMYVYHKNKSYLIKDESKITDNIKEKTLIETKIKSKKRKPLIIKFRKTKKRKVLLIKFRKPKKVKSQYEINMELLERKPGRKELVDTIIQMIMEGKTNKEIAKELNIKRDFVNHIRVRDNYGWYTKDYEFPDIYKSRYTDQMFLDIANLLVKGYSNEKIVSLLPEYNLTRHTINAVRRHRMGRELLKDWKFPEPVRGKKKDKKLYVQFRINGIVI